MSVGSSMSKKHARPGKKHNKSATVRTLVGHDHNITYMPEARHEEDNGWQVRCEDVKTRISTLFNCYTMSDLIFQVEGHAIPAHKFVLGTASPVFCKMLWEDDRPQARGPLFGANTGRLDSMSLCSDGGGSLTLAALGGYDSRSYQETHSVVPIEGIPHLTFFEFLQFMYTDTVTVNLDNALHLIFLADWYKVAGLSEICFEFLQGNILPHTVLKVLQLVRELWLKALITSWRDATEENKSGKSLRRLPKTEQRRIAQGGEEEQPDIQTESAAPSRRNSIGGRSARSITESDVGSRLESESDVETTMDFDYRSVSGRVPKNLQSGFKGQMMKTKISLLVEGLNRACWKCIQEDTGLVISSAEFFEQDLSMLRRILRLETCSVPEIMLFRACNEWAERSCKKAGMTVTEETKRAVLGDSTLKLIRFPCMSVDEFQWEVVPTGILPYEDVQSLLHSLTNRMTGFIGDYSVDFRSNKTLKLNSLAAESTRSVFAEPEKPVYCCIEDDPLDCMLGAELLRSFLKSESESQSKRHPNAGPPDVPTSPAAAKARLPPLAARGGGTAGGPRGEPVPPSSPSRGNQPRRAKYEMVMGTRIDAEDAGEGVIVQGGGRRAMASDFQRLAPGFYRFRETRLVEIWLHHGEAMVTNHGTNEALSSGNISLTFPDGTMDAATARAEFNIPVGRAQMKGGVPLVSFLCRQ